MEKKQIYLAGAMEVYADDGYPALWRDSVKEYFNMHSDNFCCISPADYYSYGNDESKKYAEILRFDLRLVSQSDIVLVNMNDIRKSIGTSDEILYAYLLDKPIIGFCTDLDNNCSLRDVVDYVHSWKYEQLDRLEIGRDSMMNACDYILRYYSHV